MAKSSLDDSTSVENPPDALRIAFTHLAQDYALIHIALGKSLPPCSPSLIHDYWWLRSNGLEKSLVNLDLGWKARRVEGHLVLSE